MTKSTSFVVLSIAITLLLVAVLTVHLRPASAESTTYDTGRFTFEHIGDDTIYMFDKESGILRIWKKAPGGLVTTFNFRDPEVVLQEDFKYRTGV